MGKHVGMPDFSVPKYATDLVRGFDTDSKLVGFQVRDNSGIVANGRPGGGYNSSTRALVETPAVAPTMAGRNAILSSGNKDRLLGALKLPVPIGYEIG